jgi:hypothetical protein
MKYAHRQSRASSFCAYSAQHVECLCIAHMIAQIDHRPQSILFDYSADAFSLICDHRWKQPIVGLFLEVSLSSML